MRYKERINQFLREELNLELHPEKSKIRPLKRGIEFLGFRTFHHHKLLRERAVRRFYWKLNLLETNYQSKKIDYDQIYDFLEGWTAYAKQADTYKKRRKIMIEIEEKFNSEISTKEVNRLIKEH